MNILVTVDSNYVRPLKVMLTSFFTYHKNENQIYLLYSNVKETELAELRSMIEEGNSQFFPVRMEERLLSDVPVFRYFTKEMYYRLFAGVMFLGKDKMLYLDPDILIRGSLEDLYETDIEGNILAGVADYAINHMAALSVHKDELGIEEREQYINSGVLLLNLKELRKRFRGKDIEKIVREKGDLLLYPDQDIINLLFRGRIKLLERKYNYNTGYGSFAKMLRYIAGGFVKEKQYPVIVHYMGASKPWHPEYYGKFGKEYRRYLKQYPDPNPEAERKWKRRHIAVIKHLTGVVIHKVGGKNHGK